MNEIKRAKKKYKLQNQLIIYNANYKKKKRRRNPPLNFHVTITNFI